MCGFERLLQTREMEAKISVNGFGGGDKLDGGILMTFDDYKVVLYRNQPDGWVADIPSIPGCHA